MSIVSWFNSVRNGLETSGPSSAWHIIDASSLQNGNNIGRMAPRDLLGLLQKIAGFVEREQIQAAVVLAGRPLREAPDGSVFKTTTVYYAETPDALSAILDKLAHSRRDSLVVTQNGELEKKLQAAGIATLRGSTLRKAMEEGGRGDGGRAGNARARRKPRSRRAGPNNAPPKDAEDPKEAPAKPHAKESDGVSDLIDLV